MTVAKPKISDNGTTSKIGNNYDDEERAKGFKRNKIYKQNSRP
jgi:hypothetical protein